MQIAAVLVAVIEAYAAIGVVFAGLFVTLGISRIDHEAAGGTVGFQLIIFPGAAGLWPLLLARWVRGTGEPPEEQTPHSVQVKP